MTSSFSVADYFIFGTIFVLSATAGAVFGYKDRNSQSTEKYYFGGRKIAPIPVAISISVSYVSAITMIGMPTEIYSFGNVFAWYILAVAFANIVGFVYYVPVFHRLHLNSLYEYLELRFCKKLRHMASAIGVVYMGLYIAIAIFVPSLALSAVTPLSLNFTIALISLTCTFYTTLGGMKAVIWTDVLQSVIMILGIIAVLIRGCITVGGFDAVISAVERGGRNNFLKFDVDPRIRSTFWTMFVSYTVISLFEIVCNQTIIQRWLSCKSIKDSRIAVAWSLVFLVVLTALSITIGLMMYTYFEECDPLQSGKIKKMDQMLPLLVVEIFENMPGMAGLFVAAAFSGALSTISSGINSLSALTLMDFILSKFPDIKSSRQVVLSKILTVLFGLTEMSLAYAMSLTSSNAIEIVGSVAGFTGGPILSVFTMGIMMPWINSKGAIAGLIVGFGFTTWVGVSAILYSSNSINMLPTSIKNCTALNMTVSTSNNNATYSQTTNAAALFLPNTFEMWEDKSISIYNTLCAISPFHYGMLGFLISIVIAHVTSLISGFSKPSEADNRLFVPLFDNKLLPTRVKKIFRFGVPEREVNINQSTGEELKNLTVL